MATSTRLDEAVAEAVECRRAFDGAESRLRAGLSPASFVKEALANAGVTPKDLAELDKRLNSPGFEHALMGVREVVKSFTVEHGPRASRPGRRVRHYWDDDGRAQLGAAGATELGAYALGVKLAAAVHPDAFGDVDSWSVAEQDLADAKAALEDAVAAIEKAWGADDVEVEAERVSFRRWPGVVVSNVDLGRRILDAALNSPEPVAAAA